MKITLTTTVKIKSETSKLLPIKTDRAVPVKDIEEMMEKINSMELEPPVKIGDIVIEKICGKKVNLIATKTIEK